LSNRPQSELLECGISRSRISSNTQSLSENSQKSPSYHDVTPNYNDDGPLYNDKKNSIATTFIIVEIKTLQSLAVWDRMGHLRSHLKVSQSLSDRDLYVEINEQELESQYIEVPKSDSGHAVIIEPIYHWERVIRTEIHGYLMS